ncbi:MAG: hypothetical protein KIT20_14540, partial [Alphaproteobacteria bacterium]|nr:hypothetical protein [Alphaproteobacteria bacterium]
PPAAGDPAPAPVFAPPPVTPPRAEGETPPRRPSVFGPDVQVRPLAEVDPSSAGLIFPQNGGFPPDLWLGSSLATVQPLLARLAPSRSPAAQLMAQRLLTSAAEVPEGSGDGPTFLETRIERALALGRLGEVEGLSRLAGRLSDSIGIRQAAIAGRFLTGATEQACAGVAELVLKVTDEETLKANAYCRAMGGDRAGAELSAALLREQGVADKGFFSLLAAQNDRAAKLDGVDARSALHLAMLRTARRPIAAEYVEAATPGGLWSLAELQAGPPALMLLAAEKAMGLGVLLPQDLARAYGAVTFSPADLGNAANAAKALGDARGNALLFQAATSSPVAGQRLELINAGYRAFAAGHGRVHAARLYGDPMRSVPPAREFAWAAQNAVRILLIAGDLVGARAWHNLLFQAAEGDRRGAALTAALLQLVDAEAPFRPQSWLEDWLAVREQAGTREERDAQAALLLTLLDALGYEVPTDLWQRLYARAPAPAGEAPASPLLLRGLASAADAGRLGETVLFALLVLGEEGPAKLDGTGLAAVIGGLRKVGLERDARALALEAALARGL